MVLVEGESDCHTLWFHEIPALGIPGASNWRDGWATYLDGIEKIYAIIEPDQGGDTLREKLTGCEAIRERLHLLELGEHKDPSALHLADPDRFKERFEVALEEGKALGRAGEGGGRSDVSRGVGAVQRAGEGTEHPGALRRRACSARASPGKQG